MKPRNIVIGIAAVLLLGVALFFGLQPKQENVTTESFKVRPEEKIVHTGNWIKVSFPKDYRHSMDVSIPSNWINDCCQDAGGFSAHWFYPGFSSTARDMSPAIVVIDYSLELCKNGSYGECGVQDIRPASADTVSKALLAYIDKKGEVPQNIASLKKTGSVKIKNISGEVLVFKGQTAVKQPVEFYLVSHTKGVFAVVFQKPEYFEESFKKEFLDRLIPVGK